MSIQKNATPFDPLYLTEEDWNFESVPPGEIIACSLWEYARESPTIAMAADQRWCNVRHTSNRERYELEPGLKAEHDEVVASIEGRLRSSGFDYGNFVETFWASDLALVEIYQSLIKHVIDGASPWQRLPLEQREQLSQQVSESCCLRPIAPSLVGELEQLWNANRAELDKARSDPCPEYDDSEDAALYTDAAPVMLAGESMDAAPGKMAVSFSVDFSRFTDVEICEEMRTWLVANRPPHWKSPRRVFPDSKERGRKRSGKQTEYYTALNRLGLMRLLHRLTPNEIRHELPRAWDKYKQKQDVFRREIREACKFFQRLFPFLPQNERPNSELRKGVWFPEMMKVCDKIEDDLGLR